MVNVDRLYDTVGHEGLFNSSHVLGKVGFRLSGHSTKDALFPLHWRLSSLGDDRKAEMAITPNLKDLYGNWHPFLDRSVNVNVKYLPQTRTFIKDTWLNENFALQNESIVGGAMIENVKARVKGTVNRLCPLNVDFDIVAPLDKTITEQTNAQLQLNLEHFFLAGDVSFNKLSEPSIKFGYKDRDLSAMVENTNKVNWTFEATKQADQNTLVGMKSNVKRGDVSVAVEHVFTDNTEVKVAVTNKDLLSVEYTKQFPHVTTTLALQSTGLITTGQAGDLKFGFGVEIDL